MSPSLTTTTTILLLISLLMTLTSAHTSPNTKNILLPPTRPLQRRQRFIPPTNSGEGATCADAFGAGYVECVPASAAAARLCVNPDLGETCCNHRWGCPAQSFCLVEPFCCPEGIDPASCAAELGVSLSATGAGSTGAGYTGAESTGAESTTVAAVTSALNSEPSSAEVTETVLLSSAAMASTAALSSSELVAFTTASMSETAAATAATSVGGGNGTMVVVTPTPTASVSGSPVFTGAATAVGDGERLGLGALVGLVGVLVGVL